MCEICGSRYNVRVEAEKNIIQCTRDNAALSFAMHMGFVFFCCIFSMIVMSNTSDGSLRFVKELVPLGWTITALICVFAALYLVRSWRGVHRRLCPSDEDQIVSGMLT